MFRKVPLSVIMSFSLYTQQWYMSYRFADSLRAGSGWNYQRHALIFSNLFLELHISLLCAQWKTPDDGQRNCPKHVEFHSKNKFEKSVHLVGFIMGNFILCTVTRTSNSFITHRCPPPPPAWCMFRPSHSPWSDHAHAIWQSLAVLRLSHVPHYAACRIILVLSAIPTTSYAQTPDCTGVQHGTPKFEPSTSQKPHALCQQPKFSS
jgi:hypothetical protein